MSKLLTRFLATIVLSPPVRQRLHGTVLSGIAAALARQSGRGELAGELASWADPLPPPAPHVAGLHDEALRLVAGSHSIKAARLMAQALTQAPDDVACLGVATIAHTMSKQYEAAEIHGRHALALAPRVPAIHLNLGHCLRAAGRGEDALEHYYRAIELAPDLSDAHASCGHCLSDLHLYEQAVPHLREALALAPDNLPIRLVLCGLLLELNELGQAAEQSRTALCFSPGSRMALNHLGNTLRRQERMDESVACHRRALFINPDAADTLNSLGFTLTKVGRHGEAMKYHEKAVRLAPDNVGFAKNLLLSATYNGEIGNDRLKQIHQRFGRAFKRPTLPRPTNDPTPDRPLRIGFLSSDLHSHPVASNLLPVLRCHDRSRFALHFYANVVKPDQITAQIHALSDGWCDTRYLSDADVADRVRADGIDILVCLAARFDRNRPVVCSYRPAPVQISLHDVATSGLAKMDYLVADRHLAPGDRREFFSERVLRLPLFYVGEIPANVTVPGKPDDGSPAVFACFNNPAKITPPVLRCWGRVLAALPDSRLQLKYTGYYQSDSLRQRISDMLVQAGVQPAQVEFHEKTESYLQFLGRYNDVDLALDTFPFSGSTTSFQALSMGVPVVTWPMDRMVARWTAAMLKAVDLETFIAGSEDDYVAVAVAAARDVGSWRRQRQAIRDRVAASSLCDAAGWTRHMERLYRAVWRKYCASTLESGFLDDKKRTR